MSGHTNPSPRTPRKPQVEAVEGIDLEWQPSSYHADLGPVEAILQGIAGEERRAMVREKLTRTPRPGDRDVEEWLLQDRLTEEERVLLGQVHPRYMGGEYLPERSTGEVEIARVSLQSSTGDVYSLCARRVGSRWRYRLYDEYGAKFCLTPATSRGPLTLRQLVHMLDTVEGDEIDTLGQGLVFCWPAWQQENGDSPREAIAFVSVSSEVYPMLEAYYEARLEAWAAEYEEEDDSEDEDEIEDGDEQQGEEVEEEEEVEEARGGDEVDGAA
jgi:hypothetical protein